ncbi:MAG: threonylcarbamoyl-AMP synthase [Puniceicoccales bacterium]|nr:threonylcarbamoyl-AMP synthase [Puniceicoccales bacterium]
MGGGARILEATPESIREVVDILLAGEVVALPTETVYGLAAVINDGGALRKIFQAKGRPSYDPLIIHALDLSGLLDLVEVGGVLLDKLRRLCDAFCPGPLTFVLRKRKAVSDIITAGKKTVAIRIPSHPIFREILRRTGPLAAPSANPFGYVSPTCAEHVRISMGEKISHILDGGPCEIGVESTILDLSGRRFTILRPGAITAEMVSEVLGEGVELLRPVASTDPAAPGMLRQHYSPHTKLRLFRRSAEEVLLNFGKDFGKNVAIVYLSRNHMPLSGEGKWAKNIFWLSEGGDWNEVARNIFALLRRLDGMQFDLICCQVPEKIGVGAAINDRLSRAAAKF